VQIDQAVLIAAIGTLGGLLLLVVRLFLTGKLYSSETVPRHDYDRQIAIVESYAQKFGEQTDAIRTMAATQEKLINDITANTARASRSRTRSDGR
jgi:hypothetical protein